VRGSHKRNALLSEGSFLGLQIDYELMARRRQIADQLKAIRPRAA
jgi:antitoxin HigA-1